MIDLKNKLTEEEAREIYAIAVWGNKDSDYARRNAGGFIDRLKQYDIIQQNAYEELMEWVDSMKGMAEHNRISAIDFAMLKEKLQAYHDEKHSLSPAVKEAREKIDRFIDERIQCNKLWSAEELWELIQSERQIVDAMIKEGKK